MWYVNVQEAGQFDNLLHHKKQIDVSFLCLCPVMDYGYHHNIVKVVW